MNWRLAWLFALLCQVSALSAPVLSEGHSTSQSRQFIVYGLDASARALVNNRADEAKAAALSFLGEPDLWKIPIVISLRRAATWGPSDVRLIETPGGTSIRIAVQIGDGPAGFDLRRQIVRAVLLDICYRDRPPIKGGESYFEPPWWLVSGTLQSLRQREAGVASELFKGIIEANRVPDIGDFLTLHAEEPGAAAQAVDGAYSLCLIQLLAEQPGGKAALARLLRRWPELQADPLAALLKEFSDLAGSANELQKWWTLNMARLADSDRYKGLSPEDTDKQLQAILSVSVVVNKAGEKKTFALRQFEEFMALPGGKSALDKAHSGIVALSASSHVLYRPILADYEQIFASLLGGSPKGIGNRIAAVERYRNIVSKRIGDIADYLNWYELQLGTKSDAFDSFLKAAHDLSTEELRRHREDPVTKYLDQLEQEF